MKRRTRITESFVMTLTGREIRDVINFELAAQGDERIPDHAQLFVHVPGGGDWSLMDLDLDEYPLEIRWTIEEWR